jgi:hypothetical protein
MTELASVMVSRYKVYWEQVTYPLTQVWLRAAAGLSRLSEASNGITVMSPYTVFS